MKQKRKNCFYFIVILLLVIFGIIFWINNRERNINADTNIKPATTISATSENPTGNLPQITAASTAADSEKLKEYKAPILMYHYIRDYNNAKDTTGTNLSVSLAKFDSQLKWLNNNGYKTVGLDYLLNPIISDKKPVILTFDDGYQDAYTQAFPILKKYGFTATFYIITAYMDKYNNYLTWDQARELKSAGMNIGSHTHTHPDLSKIFGIRVTDEIKESKKTIEEKIGGTISDFCYPAGKYDQKIIDELKNDDYKTATTVKNGIANQNSNLFELPRIRMQNNTNMEKIFNF